VLRQLSLDCEWFQCCDARSEATWCVSSSTPSCRPAVVSGFERETLTVVGSGMTSQILSARWEADSRPSSVWPASITCMCGGNQMAQMVRRKSSGTSVLGPWDSEETDGFRSPISSCKRSCRTHCWHEVKNRRTSSALRRRRALAPVVKFWCLSPPPLAAGWVVTPRNWTWFAGAW